MMDEAAGKRRSLERKQAFATGLLLVAAAIFASLQFAPANFFVRLLTASAEAALVGGLADWFAVTALFRHPLGIPIPHTALIPSQKNEIGRSLGNFVRDKFLDPALVIERLRAHNRALQLARWLDSEGAARFISDRVVDLIPHLLKSINDEEFRRFVGNLAQEGFRRIDLMPVTDAAIAALVDSGKHMALIDAAALLVESSLGALREPIVERVGARTGRFFPKYFDRKIGKGIVNGAQEWLRAVRQPHSEERLKTDRWIRERVAEFRASPDYRQLIENARTAVLANPALIETLGAIWDEAKREITNDLQRQSPQIRVTAAKLVRMTGQLLQQTPAMQDYVNAALERLIVDYIAPWRAQISSFIADVVAGWDARTVAELVELEIGGDLQYVRINGTLVGALIGTALFLISAATAQIELAARF
jgi:uncharacterized membrane-anchored protein YjiN (DUF445 family)